MIQSHLSVGWYSVLKGHFLGDLKKKPAHAVMSSCEQKMSSICRFILVQINPPFLEPSRAALSNKSNSLLHLFYIFNQHYHFTLYHVGHSVWLMSHRNTWAQRWRRFIHRMISISNVLQSFSLHLIRATQMCSNTTITTHSSKHTRAKRSLSWMLAFLKFSKQKFSVALTLLEAGKIKQQTRLNFTSNYNTASNQTGNLRQKTFFFIIFVGVYKLFSYVSL